MYPAPTISKNSGSGCIYMCLRSRRGFRRDERSSYEVGALFEQLVFKLRVVQGDRVNQRVRGVENETR